MTKTIILIDDDQDDIEIMLEAIKAVDSSAVCVTFTDPEEALCAILDKLNFLPDFIFIDINMPKIIGDDCLSKIRGDLDFRATTVIMFSTVMSNEDSKRFHTMGANFTFAKPSKMEEYHKILRHIFSLESGQGNH